MIFGDEEVGRRKSLRSRAACPSGCTWFDGVGAWIALVAAGALLPALVLLLWRRLVEPS